MTEQQYEYPTFELLLDTTLPGEVEDGKAKAVQAGAGESFTMKCIVKGEHHEEPDLNWIKDGKEILESDALNVTDSSLGDSPSKSIIVSNFNATTHNGLYACSVKRKDEKYHSRSMRLEQKPGNSQIPDGHTVCPANHQNNCFNGGICMMLTASGSISCLCPSNYIGPRCESVAVDVEGQTKVLHVYHGMMVAMSVIIIAFLIIMCVCCYCSKKQRKKIESLTVEVNRLKSSSYPEQENSPLNNMSNQFSNEVFDKLQSTEVQEELYCWKCGSGQLCQGRPIDAAQNSVHRESLSRDFSPPNESAHNLMNNKTSERTDDARRHSSSS